MKPINLRRAIKRGAPSDLDKWGAGILKEAMSDPTKEKSLFYEAMDQFSKLAQIALKALKPYVNHGENCATPCPACELKKTYWEIENMVTRIEK